MGESVDDDAVTYSGWGAALLVFIVGFIIIVLFSTKSVENYGDEGQECFPGDVCCKTELSCRSRRCVK